MHLVHFKNYLVTVKKFQAFQFAYQDVFGKSFVIARAQDSDIGGVGPGPGKIDQVFSRDSRCRDFKAEAVPYGSLGRYAVTTFFHYDGVAISKLNSRKPAFQQKIIQIGVSDNFSTSHHTHIPVTAPAQVDAAGSLQKIQYGIRGDARIATRTVHEAGDKYLHRRGGLEVGVDIDVLGEHALEGATDGSV